jgi:hypothetical protein
LKTLFAGGCFALRRKLLAECTTWPDFVASGIDQASEVFDPIYIQALAGFVMTDSEMQPDAKRRARVDRRSGVDTRSEEEKLMGDRRSQIDRRASRASQQPSNEQLALFAKRVRRAIRDEGSRHIFGIASGEGDFRGYPDVLRTLDWIEGRANS